MRERKKRDGEGEEAGCAVDISGFIPSILCEVAGFCWGWVGRWRPEPASQISNKFDFPSRLSRCRQIPSCSLLRPATSSFDFHSIHSSDCPRTRNATHNTFETRELRQIVMVAVTCGDFVGDFARPPWRAPVALTSPRSCHVQPAIAKFALKFARYTCKFSSNLLLFACLEAFTEAAEVS